MFDKATHDFLGGMVEKPKEVKEALYVSNIIQKAYIEVNEDRSGCCLLPQVW